VVSFTYDHAMGRWAGRQTEVETIHRLRQPRESKCAVAANLLVDAWGGEVSRGGDSDSIVMSVKQFCYAARMRGECEDN